MAYSTTVTRLMPSKLTEDDYTVRVNVKINDGVDDVFDKDFSARYYSQLTVGDIKSTLQAQIKEAWDEYMDEKGIFDSAAFDNMCGDIENSTDVYVNS